MSSITTLIVLSFLLVLTVLWLSFSNENEWVSEQHGEKANMLNSNRHRHIVPSQVVIDMNTPQPVSGETTSLQMHADGKRATVDVGKLDPPSSPYAYVTLIHGIDDTFRYRGYLYNVMIMKTALASFGSTADFIVLLGFSQDGNRDIFQSDINSLKDIGVRIYYLPRLVDTPRVHFGEMALLKVTPWSFIQYEKIQFFDGDIMPRSNMDCLFQLPQNTFNVGNASPLNSGWFLAIPNMEDFDVLRSKAVARLRRNWDEVIGWGEVPPAWLVNAHGKHIFQKWTFNGASLDQGLLTHYFMINQGRVIMFNGVSGTKKYDGHGQDGRPVQITLHPCKEPTVVSMFAHFTGKSKPWLTNLRYAKKGSPLQQWGNFLDALHLPVNSSNIHLQALKPPLGYFHPNK